MKLWLNGVLHDAGTACIDPTDRGLLLGDGVFETVRASGTLPHHLPRHLARLRAGATVLGIAVPWTDDQIAEAAAAILPAQDGSAVRITLTRGPASRGLLPPAGTAPTLLLTAAALAPSPPPAHLVIATITRRNEHSPLSRIKSLNYLDSILARQEAARRGADDAVLLNTAGLVAEATAGNVFVLHGETWSTPPVEDGALPGIVRALLLESGRAVVARLSVARLLSADAVCLTSALGVREVFSVEGASKHGALPQTPLGS